MYGIHAELFFACEDETIIEQIYYAFKDPTYALTLSNSDELIKITNLEIISELSTGEENHLKTHGWRESHKDLNGWDM